MSIETINEAYSLLGDSVVLLQLHKGTKIPKSQNWTAITLEESKDPIYQAELNYSNVGVLLGSASAGLCTIDLDSDSAMNEMLKLNESLRNTLITRGNRGCNLWIRILGSYPKSQNFKKWGEWRANGSQTVLRGRHPEGMYYTTVNKSKVISVRFSDINWPSHVSFNSIPSSSSTSSLELNSDKLNSEDLKTVDLCVSNALILSDSSAEAYAPTSLRTMEYGNMKCDAVPLCIPNQIDFEKTAIDAGAIVEIEERIVRWKEASKGLPILELYVEHFEPYFEAQPGNRNATIVAAGKRLFYSVSAEIAKDLLMVFYDTCSPIFTASRNEHNREVESLFKGLEDSYLSEISSSDLKIFKALRGKYSPMFRIMRDLAKRQKDLRFFLSARELSIRINVTPRTAARMLRQFVKLGILEVVSKGKQYTKGEKPVATTFKWRLPIEQSGVLGA